MKTVIFYCESMAQRAKDIVDCYPEDFELGDIKWNYFPDDECDFQIQDLDESVEYRDIVFLASMRNRAERFDELSVLYAFAAYGAKSLKVVLPYFPTSTKDRIHEKGDIVTSKTLSRMISAIPSPIMMKPEVFVYDIHDIHQLHYFSDFVRVKDVSAIPLAKEIISDIETEYPIDICLPDLGAFDRFGNFFGKHVIQCEKKRDKNDPTKREIFIVGGDPRGKHVVIIDDLIMSGSTLIMAKDKLLEAGAREVSAYATHAVFPNDAYIRLQDAGFKNIIITDSCIKMAEIVENIKPFYVISLAQDIANMLKRAKDRLGS